MFDRAVLPRPVHRLEDEEHRPAILRVEQFRQLVEPARTFLEQTPGAILGVERLGISWVVPLQRQLPGGRDPESIDVDGRILRHVASRDS